MKGLNLFLTLLLISGCSSLDKPAGASFASVEINHHSPDEIRRVTMEVFTAAGYQTRFAALDNLMFEKEGTRRQQITHGGWLQDRPIKERVRAEIVSVQDGSQRLQCKAYIVEDAGDALFETEKKMVNIRSGPYQELLNRVAAQLK